MPVRTEYVDVDFKVKLKKDLLENEVLCDRCKGTGLVVDGFAFGVAGEKRRLVDPLPHKKQMLSFCPSCYNGVQKKCEYCGKFLGRQVWCDCEGFQEKRREERYKKELEVWEQANKVGVKDLGDYENMLYLENYNEYFSSVDDLLDFIVEEVGINNIENLRVYKTDQLNISFNAERILEIATEGLHDNAFENVLRYVKEFQALLDNFAEKIKHETVTYVPDFKNAVIITKDDLKSFVNVG